MKSPEKIERKTPTTSRRGKWWKRGKEEARRVVKKFRIQFRKCLGEKLVDVLADLAGNEGDICILSGVINEGRMEGGGGGGGRGDDVCVLGMTFAPK